MSNKRKREDDDIIYSTQSKQSPGFETQGRNIGSKNVNDVRENYTLSTRLYEACRKGDLETVKTLLKLGANVNTKSMADMTPLHVASLGIPKEQSIQPELIKHLIQQGADIEATVNGVTPLDIASLGEPNIEIVKTLIAAGANLNPGNATRTLKSALKFTDDNSELVEILLQNGAKIEQNPVDLKDLHPKVSSILQKYQQVQPSLKMTDQPQELKSSRAEDMDLS